jgi:hypothetical protein
MLWYRYSSSIVLTTEPGFFNYVEKTLTNLIPWGGCPGVMKNLAAQHWYRVAFDHDHRFFGCPLLVAGTEFGNLAWVPE